MVVLVLTDPDWYPAHEKLEYILFMKVWSQLEIDLQFGDIPKKTRTFLEDQI